MPLIQFIVVSVSVQATEAEDRGNDASLLFVFDNARMDYAQKP